MVVNKIPFCPKCGSILNVHPSKGKEYGVCRCGYASEVREGFSFGQKVIHTATLGAGVLKEETEEGFPHDCKRCGYGECELVDLGCSYADESNIYLYKCKKCGHVERQADGTGNS